MAHTAHRICLFPVSVYLHIHIQFTRAAIILLFSHTSLSYIQSKRVHQLLSMQSKYRYQKQETVRFNMLSLRLLSSYSKDSFPTQACWFPVFIHHIGRLFTIKHITNTPTSTITKINVTFNYGQKTFLTIKTST